MVPIREQGRLGDASMTDDSTARSLREFVFLAPLLLLAAVGSAISNIAAAEANCSANASGGCYLSIEPPGAMGRLSYLASQVPQANSSQSGPAAVLIAMHGHPRDVEKTFNATLLAVQRANAEVKTLVIAPLFQVAAPEAAKCRAPGTPAAQTGDLQWTCESWLSGGPARNGSGLTSFAAMDSLISELLLRWPSLRSVTVAGFSAGAQMVQHYIGFAAAQPTGPVTIRYVVSDPGTWLYFDALRPQPMQEGRAVDWLRCSGGLNFLGNCTLEFTRANNACPELNRWKYGTESLPDGLGRSAAEARVRYSQADITYLEGELDSGSGPGTFHRILDKSCPASTQGPYRMQRGLAYAQYDRTFLAPEKQRKVVVVPGCAHDVACVFPSEVGRAALLGPQH